MMPIDERLLISPLRYWAQVAEDRQFFTFSDLDGRGARFSYGEFYDGVRRLARGLLASGLRPGGRCVLHTGNTLGFMFAFWALQEMGAVAVPTIVQYSDDELRYVVEHCEASLLICSPDLLGVAQSAVDDLGCEILVDDLGAVPAAAGADGGGSLSEAMAESPGAVMAARAGDLAIILYTSGTTARPKGVMLGNAGSIYTATSFAHHMRLLPGDAVLTCLPLFHVNGMFLQMMPAVVSGARFILTPRFSGSQYWGWLREHAVTFGHLLAGPIRVLLGMEPDPQDRTHHLRAMSYALPLTKAETDAFEERFGIPLAMVWGQTETSCAGTMMPLHFGRRPGYQHIGPPMLGWEVRVCDDGGSEAPVEEAAGELLVRSPGVMLGYYKDAEATALTLQDGWVRTGDLGVRDTHGYFHFVDRIKDMLKPSGENVAASEIEAVILSHPAVDECAVVGVPDPVRFEKVVALVVPAPDSVISPDEVQALCGERLARFKVPSIVEIRAELPKTSIGKIRKGELRRELRGERDPAPSTERGSDG